MKIPPYWAKSRYQGTDPMGRSQSFVVCGWSFNSLAEAKDQAAKRARRIFDLITSGQKPEQYDYHDRPIKEEIVSEIADGGPPIAVITRNRYGALVLNCSSILFVDVDFPRVKPAGLFDFLVLSFSRAKWMARKQVLEEETIRGVEDWARRNPRSGFRLYRTREGLRLLFTDKLYEPASSETATLMRELQADPMYVTLTRKQDCFRARLTSKPWRCGCDRPPGGFPREDEKAEMAYRQWEEGYTQRDAGFKVCELVAAFGQPPTNTQIERIVALHDRETRVEATGELA